MTRPRACAYGAAAPRACAGFENRDPGDRGSQPRHPRTAEKTRRPTTIRTRGQARGLAKPTLRIGAIARPSARCSNAEGEAAAQVGQAVRYLPLHGSI